MIITLLAAAVCTAVALFAAHQARKARQQSAALTDRIRNARSELQAAVDELTATAQPPTDEAPPALIDMYRNAIRVGSTPTSRSTRPPRLRLVRVHAFPYRGGHNDVCAYAAGIGRYCTCHTKDQP